jgi:hypothetical protein
MLEIFSDLNVTISFLWTRFLVATFLKISCNSGKFLTQLVSPPFCNQIVKMWGRERITESELAICNLICRSLQDDPPAFSSGKFTLAVFMIQFMQTRATKQTWHFGNRRVKANEEGDKNRVCQLKEHHGCLCKLGTRAEMRHWLCSSWVITGPRQDRLNFEFRIAPRWE